MRDCNKEQEERRGGERGKQEQGYGKQEGGAGARTGNGNKEREAGTGIWEQE